MIDLRALDAEFAEKVLEMSIGSYAGYKCRVLPLNPRELSDAVPTYTLSLDAAWQGVEKLKSCEVKFANMRPNEWDCELDGCCARGQTPAEALVRACLEAVKPPQEAP